MKLKKGDTVKILSGKDKGKTGKIIQVLPDATRIVVENVNMRTRFQKSKQAGKPGMKVNFSGSLHASNVILIDPSSGKPTRIGYKVDGKTKTRVARKSGKSI